MSDFDINIYPSINFRLTYFPESLKSWHILVDIATVVAGC